MIKKIKQIKKNWLETKLATRKIMGGPERELFSDIDRLQREHPNPFVKYGKKCFSQADEDGLLIEIIRRIEIENGTFVEFGCGDGRQNNSLILLALNWRGIWVGGQDLVINTLNSKRLRFFKSWVTLDNILETYKSGVEALAIKDIDLVSMDLDGNDLYFIEELLSNGVAPKIFIAEYNGKFPPPVKFTIEYDAAHTWKSDDYTGASLSSLVELFEKYDYKLICCNAATGVNAFFVKNKYAPLFPEVPNNIEEIYSKPFYFEFRKYGHHISERTLELIINR